MINAYLVDDVILHKSNGNDQWGEPLADTAIPLKGKVKIGTALVKDIKGENVYSSMSILIQTRAIGHEDTIEYGGKKYTIVSISNPRSFSWGYIEVFIK